MWQPRCLCLDQLITLMSYTPHAPSALRAFGFLGGCASEPSYAGLSLINVLGVGDI